MPACCLPVLSGLQHSCHCPTPRLKHRQDSTSEHVLYSCRNTLLGLLFSVQPCTLNPSRTAVEGVHIGCAVWLIECTATAYLFRKHLHKTGRTAAACTAAMEFQPAGYTFPNPTPSPTTQPCKCVRQRRTQNCPRSRKYPSSKPKLMNQPTAPAWPSLG